MFDSIKAFLILIIISYNLPESSQAFKNGSHKFSQSSHYELVRQSVPLFENKTFTICVVVREPFVLFNDIKAEVQFDRSRRLYEYNAIKDLNNYSGIAIEVLKLLSVIFKFKIDLVRPSDNEFGILKANKTWSGVVGYLARKQADLGVTALSITFGRSEVIDFTRAYYVETAAILLPIPEEIQNYSAMIEPFSPSVWFILFATVVVLILLITIMTKLEEDQRKQQRLAKLLEYRAKKSCTSNNKEQTKISNDDLKDLNQSFIRTTWLDRFYYGITCVLNILLIRGEFGYLSLAKEESLICSFLPATFIRDM